MPIAPAELKEYKSLNANSDGGDIDLTRPIPSGGLNNLWPDITSAQAAVGGTDYRKVFRRNDNPSLTWGAVVSWIAQQPQGLTVSVGLGLGAALDNDPAQGNMVALTGPSRVYLSSSAADTRTATVIGENVSGVRQTEAVVLTGTTPVGTAATFGKVYAIQFATGNANTVTATAGASGPVIGTVGPNKVTCWLWRDADLAGTATAYQHGDITSFSSFALWFRRVWGAGLGSIQGATEIVRSQGGTPA